MTTLRGLWKSGERARWTDFSPRHLIVCPTQNTAHFFSAHTTPPPRFSPPPPTSHLLSIHCHRSPHHLTPTTVARSLFYRHYHRTTLLLYYHHRPTTSPPPLSLNHLPITPSPHSIQSNRAWSTRRPACMHASERPKHDETGGRCAASVLCHGNRPYYPADVNGRGQCSPLNGELDACLHTTPRRVPLFAKYLHI